jgi:hypothetical protein
LRCISGSLGFELLGAFKLTKLDRALTPRFDKALNFDRVLDALKNISVIAGFKTFVDQKLQNKIP